MTSGEVDTTEVVGAEVEEDFEVDEDFWLEPFVFVSSLRSRSH